MTESHGYCGPKPGFQSNSSFFHSVFLPFLSHLHKYSHSEVEGIFFLDAFDTMVHSEMLFLSQHEGDSWCTLVLMAQRSELGGATLDLNGNVSIR